MAKDNEIDAEAGCAANGGFGEDVCQKSEVVNTTGKVDSSSSAAGIWI